MVICILYLLGCTNKDDDNLMIKYTIDDIKTMCEKDCYSPVDWMYKYIKTDGTYEEYEKSFDGLTKSQRLIFALSVYLNEVYNGGHDQFLFNSSGIVWKDAREALELIDYKEGYDILNDVVNYLDGDIPFEWNERRKVLSNKEVEIEDKFNEYDGLVYTMNYDEKIKSYVLNHAEDFLMTKE